MMSGNDEHPGGGAGEFMSVWDAIRSRRNVRAFADRPVDPAHLDLILEAARRSPSSQNWQPWDFVLVTGRERLVELAKVWQGAGHVAGSAATIALIAPAADNQYQRAQFDLGQATMSIMLAAAGLGIGSCHSGVGDKQLARELLSLPQDRECSFLISLGYPADRPLTPISKPARKPFDEVVHRERW
jgi:nitroreductase